MRFTRERAERSRATPGGAKSLGSGFLYWVLKRLYWQDRCESQERIPTNRQSNRGWKNTEQRGAFSRALIVALLLACVA